MTGYRSLLQLRQRGYRPDAVFVHVLDHAAPRGLLHADRSMADGGDAQIDIEPSDDIASLDLRAILGTTVHLAGTDAVRVGAVYARLQDFEPARILCAWPEPKILLDWTPENGLIEYPLNAHEEALA